jgi:hypothetical protein
MVAVSWGFGRQNWEEGGGGSVPEDSRQLSGRVHSGAARPTADTNDEGEEVLGRLERSWSQPPRGEGAQMLLRSSLCVFDAARVGVPESTPEARALCFLPATASPPARGSVVGLAMGLLTFSRIFSPKRPVDVMHASGHRVVFYQCEADVWAVLVRPIPPQSTWEGSEPRSASPHGDGEASIAVHIKPWAGSP